MPSGNIRSVLAVGFDPRKKEYCEEIKYPSSKHNIVVFSFETVEQKYRYICNL